MQIVLQRRSGDQQTVVCFQHPNNTRQDGVFVLDAVRLVDDDVAVVEVAEVALLLDDHFVGGDAYIEATWLQELRLLMDLGDWDGQIVGKLKSFVNHFSIWGNEQPSYISNRGGECIFRQA